jgi:hypothetical protein
MPTQGAFLSKGMGLVCVFELLGNSAEHETPDVPFHLDGLLIGIRRLSFSVEVRSAHPVFPMETEPHPANELLLDWNFSK